MVRHVPALSDIVGRMKRMFRSEFTSSFLFQIAADVAAGHSRRTISPGPARSGRSGIASSAADCNTGIGVTVIFTPNRDSKNLFRSLGGSGRMAAW